MTRNGLRIVFFALLTATLSAQDFGFGFGDEETGSAGSPLTVAIGGEVSASMVGYTDDFSDGFDQVRLGDIFSGRLNFSVRTAFADAFINLNLSPSASPVSLDEAYVHAYFGSFDVAAGLRKLTWGKADVLGPLDVINPLNSEEVYPVMADQRDLMSVKIARPLVHASYRFGQFSKIEGVFVPNFEGHYIDRTGRWADARMEMLSMENFWFGSIAIPITETETNTTTLNFAQAGIRFTTTVGSSDIGVQYYYGRLHQPSVGLILNFNPPDPIPEDVRVTLLYNPFHQIGFDYAQVLFGYNVRAELAANITEDLSGDDGSVYNPFLAWSFGFDRDIIWGINLNLQINENIRLMHDKLGSDDPMSVMTGNFDIEGGQPRTDTRLTAALSRRFLRDELELRTAVIWGMEDNDCAIMPALIWTKNDLRLAFSGGFFLGNAGGQLGQYQDNNFLQVSMTYTF